MRWRDGGLVQEAEGTSQAEVLDSKYEANSSVAQLSINPQDRRTAWLSMQHLLKCRQNSEVPQQTQGAANHQTVHFLSAY